MIIMTLQACLDKIRKKTGGKTPDDFFALANVNKTGRRTAMRYLILIKSVEGKMGPPPPALMQAIAAIGGEATQAGALVETRGLLPTAAGALVRVSGGRITVTDGPFAEGKEVIGGYAAYEVASKEEAIRWSRRFMELHAEHWPGWEGETEIRQVMAPPQAG
jgi:hypothetical protein